VSRRVFTARERPDPPAGFDAAWRRSDGLPFDAWMRVHAPNVWMVHGVS
jgi:hypothetical protein